MTERAPGPEKTPRTEPGSDLPGSGPEGLQQVPDEVAQASTAAEEAAAGPTGGGEDAATTTGGQGEGQPETSGSVPQDDAAAPDPLVETPDPLPEAPDPLLEAPDPLVEALGLAEQRLGELMRERAEFVNYRRRVERDREVAGAEARSAVLVALLPVLDDIDGARRHGDLEGPFAAVADKLDATLRRLGLEPFGEAGEAFDPTLHEALLQDGATEVDVPTCTQVLQRGYRTGERVLRPARVAVASPA